MIGIWRFKIMSYISKIVIASQKKYNTYLNSELSACWFICIRSTNKKLIRSLSAKYSYIILTFVLTTSFQITKFAMRPAAGPLQPLQQTRSNKSYIYLIPKTKHFISDYEKYIEYKRKFF